MSIKMGWRMGKYKFPCKLFIFVTLFIFIINLVKCSEDLKGTESRNYQLTGNLSDKRTKRQVTSTPTPDFKSSEKLYYRVSLTIGVPWDAELENKRSDIFRESKLDVERRVKQMATLDVNYVHVVKFIYKGDPDFILCEFYLGVVGSSSIEVLEEIRELLAAGPIIGQLRVPNYGFSFKDIPASTLCTEYACVNGNCSNTKIPCVEEDNCFKSDGQPCSEEEDVPFIVMENSNATINPIELVKLACHGDVSYNNNYKRIWTWNNRPIAEWPKLFHYSFPDVYNDVNLTIKFNAENEQGTFKCKAAEESVFVNITVTGFQEPYFVAQNLGNSTRDPASVVEAEPQLNCVVGGRPKPKISWEWQFGHSDNNQTLDILIFSLKYNNYSLFIKNVSTTAKVRFICKGENQLGKIMAYVNVSAEDYMEENMDQELARHLEFYERLNGSRYLSLSVNFNPFLPNQTSDSKLYETLAIYFNKVSERYARISMRDEDFSSADFWRAPLALAKWNNVTEDSSNLSSSLTFSAPTQANLGVGDRLAIFHKVKELADAANKIYPETIYFLQMSLSKDFDSARLSHYFTIFKEWADYYNQNEQVSFHFGVEFPVELCSADLSELRDMGMVKSPAISIKVALDLNEVVNTKLSRTFKAFFHRLKQCQPIADALGGKPSFNIGLRDTSFRTSKDDEDVFRFWKAMAMTWGDSQDGIETIGLTLMNAFDRPAIISQQIGFGWWKMVKNKNSLTGLGYDFVEKVKAEECNGVCTKTFCTAFSCNNGNCTLSEVACEEDDYCKNNVFDPLCTEEESSEEKVLFFELKDSNATVKPLETVQLACNVERYTNSVIIWTWENELISLSSWSRVYNYTLSDDNVTLSVQFHEEKVNGTFKCTVYHVLGTKSAFINILVGGFEMPYFMATNLENSTKFWKNHEKLQLICVAGGRPKPTVTWEWEEDSSVNKSSTLSMAFSLKHDNRSLFITNISTATKVRFICTGKNQVGEIVDYVDVFLAEDSFSDIYKILWVSGMTSAVFLILVVALAIIVCRYKQRKADTFFGELSLKEFYEGDIENINPELGVSDQASLLPFSQDTWEIARDRLELGKALGSGAFGLVLKAEAFGVVEGEKSTTVAVKTVQPIADESHYKALIMELKIMAHLGKHLNVVNLIGAVTKNLPTKKELYVVMEFCKYGSVLGYLHGNKNSFINQLDPTTDQIDPSICPRAGQNNKTLNNKYFEIQSSSIEVVANDTIDTSLPDYIGDYEKTLVQPLKSTDLLSWAFQAAKGMEYLASRKVLHGDLAARNVLIAENHVIKICDFGFAREKNYDYQKNINGVLLPIKWMAIESISCGIFSPKSDCWSFGVLLWELFTLGDKPYPGVAINVDFVQRLKDGFRLEKPKYSPTSVYQIMLDCWSQEASSRPQFTEVADRLKELVSTSVYTTLEDLNEQYTRLNKEVNTSVGKDYFMNMGPAEFTADIVQDEPSPDSDPESNEENPKSFLVTGDRCSISLKTKQVEYTSFKKGPRISLNRRSQFTPSKFEQSQPISQAKHLQYTAFKFKPTPPVRHTVNMIEA